MAHKSEFSRKNSSVFTGLQVCCFTPSFTRIKISQDLKKNKAESCKDAQF
jgi:hypothetical protein